MSDPKKNDLYFEKRSRADVRIWLAFVAGCVISLAVLDMTVGKDILKSAPSPTWLTAIMLVVGLGMAAVGAISLIFNTSRGCAVLFDTQELVWWQMRFPKQSILDKHRIDLRDVRAIRIDKSSDGLDVSLYDKSGQKQDTFSEAVLPPNYETWIVSFVGRFPHVEVETKE